MTRAPIIGSVQQGSQSAGQALSQAGQGSLNRLSQAFQQQQQRDLAITQAEAQRANARDMQASAIAAAHQQQIANIDAQQESQKFLADEQMKRMVVGAGLEGEARKTAFENSLMVAREEARQRAKSFDSKFTTEQRVTDARLQAARRAIETSDELTEPQRQDALRRLDVQIATNSNPMQVLGEVPPPKHPSGHEIGVPFVGEDGGLWSIEPDGTARQHSTFKESKEGVKLANEVAIRTEMAKQETKLKEREYARRDAYASAVAKYQSTGIKGKDGAMTYPDSAAVNRYASTLSQYMFPESQNVELLSAPPQIQASGALLERFAASGEQFASLSREQQRELEAAAKNVKRWRLENGQR